MQQPKLFMILTGCTPDGRHTEQHDVFFGVGNEPKDLISSMIEFWPEAKGKLHVDAWREVNFVDGYKIIIEPKADNKIAPDAVINKLFFINLGGYKINEFEEFHYKMLAVGTHKGEAIQQSKQTVFYKHTGFKSAESHVDDKYGIDVDDAYEITDILPTALKDKYTINILPDENAGVDEIHLGYFMLHKL
jgi:hypothetical protein